MKSRPLVTLALSYLLVACGGNSGSEAQIADPGIEDPVVTEPSPPQQYSDNLNILDSSNAASFSIVAADAVTVTVDPYRRATVDPFFTIMDILYAIDNKIVDSSKCDGTTGSYERVDGTNADGNPTISNTFSHFCYTNPGGTSIFFNGNIFVTQGINVDIKINSLQFSIDKTNLLLTYECTVTLAAELIDDCDFPDSTEFFFDSKWYSFKQIQVAGDDVNGFSVTGRLYSTDGYVELGTITPVLLSCLNNAPASGELSVIGANNTIAASNFSDDNECLTAQMCIFEQNTALGCETIALPEQ